jgi:hypothetical protein
MAEQGAPASGLRIVNQIPALLPSIVTIQPSGNITVPDEILACLIRFVLK